MKTLRTKNENEKNGKSGNCLKSSDSDYESNETCDEYENLTLLVDEAKTMMKVGDYHENIVNLQGITVKLMDDLNCQVIVIQYIVYLNIHIMLININNILNETILSFRCRSY